MRYFIKLVVFSMVLILMSSSLLFPQQTIKFGLHQNKPLNFRDTDSQIKGLVIDVFTHIADKENWEIEYVPCAWGDCLDKLKNGDIDVLSAIGYTQKRNSIYDFTSNPLITNWGLLVTQPNTTIQSILDLDGKTIGVMKRAGHTVAFQKLLEDFNINAKYMVADDFSAVFRLVHEKKVDAGIVNRLIASQYVNDYDVVKSSIVFNPIEIRYAFTKNRHKKKLLAVDRHMSKLRESPQSIYFHSIDRWFNDNKETGLISSWLKWLGIITLLLIGFLAISNAVLNFKVKQKTRQLKKEISERKQAEKALKKEKETLSIILESIPLGIVMIDNNNQYLYMNSTFTSITGYTLKDISSKEEWFEKVYSDVDYRKKVAKAWERDILHDGPGKVREFKIKCKDGNIKHIEFRSSFLKNEKISVLTDVTTRKKSEEMVREKDRLQGVLELSGTVSHEMSQPLMSTLGYFDLILMDMPVDDPNYSRINKIQTQLARMSNITKKLMKISRYQTKNYLNGKILDLTETSKTKN